jgi:hypothetical protein
LSAASAFPEIFQRGPEFCRGWILTVEIHRGVAHLALRGSRSLLRLPHSVARLFFQAEWPVDPRRVPRRQIFHWRRSRVRFGLRGLGLEFFRAFVNCSICFATFLTAASAFWASSFFAASASCCRAFCNAAAAALRRGRLLLRHRGGGFFHLVRGFRA